MYDYDPPYIRLDLVEKIEPLAHFLGIGDVNLSERGFLTAYKICSGSRNTLGRDMHSGKSWAEVRRAFINRFMQASKRNNEVFWDRYGNPTRRHVALLMWAFTPTPEQTMDWFVKLEGDTNWLNKLAKEYQDVRKRAKASKASNAKQKRLSAESLAGQFVNQHAADSELRPTRSVHAKQGDVLTKSFARRSGIERIKGKVTKGPNHR